MAMISVGAYASICCMTVISDLAPCAGFVSGTAAQPPKACCDGIGSLNAATNTKTDRQAACKCVKSLIGCTPINYTRAGELPKRCGVNIGIPISPSVDCSNISRATSNLPMTSPP
ncbi:non-specific lipid-transfer protein 1-like [Cryptomeria japonica]|uniref:non-specific lipid-transfer protein 1-like n=1 Tax=Cryptomeria japonica TaxID=3369 RepID=UPI0027DAACB6|nr:non-specific lipid-transfer protein 1-like [Cryptomeria japonica]